MTTLSQTASDAPPDPLPGLTPEPEFSMMGGSRILSSAADAERSARLVSWLCALIADRDAGQR